MRKFIQCLGIYPSGTVVELDSGWVGVVLRQNRNELLHPWVRVCRDARGKPLNSPRDVDLRRPEADEQVPEAHEVVRVLDPQIFGLDPDAVLRPPPPGTGSTLTVVM